MPDSRNASALGRPDDRSEQTQRHPATGPKSRLQDELADFLENATEEDFDAEKLDALLDALDEVDPLPELGSFNVQESLERFHEKYAPLFQATEAYPAAEAAVAPVKPHSRRLLFKFISIAAVVVLLLSSVTAQAFGFNIFQMFAHWTAEIFQLKNNETPYAVITKNPLAEDEEQSYETQQELLGAFGITEPLLPNWVPERLGEPAIVAKNNSLILCIQLLYECNDEFLIIQLTEVSKDNFLNVEKDADSTNVKLLSGIQHYFFSDQGIGKVIWQNGIFECRISSNIPEDELKQMINSIYED